jgi:hypothetical protein
LGTEKWLCWPKNGNKSKKPATHGMNMAEFDFATQTWQKTGLKMMHTDSYLIRLLHFCCIAHQVLVFVQTRILNVAAQGHNKLEKVAEIRMPTSQEGN